MLSRYSPLRVLAGVGRRATALTSRRAKAQRLAAARAWLRASPPPYKVNVGCGNEPFQGWANLDLERETRADFLWDITDGLPFPDNSCAFIYCEHFLEHLPVAAGVGYLAECYRCLQPGAVLRIGMPSAQALIGHYYEDTWAAQPWLQKYGFSHIKTRAEYINICFREWGHQWLYDMEELQRRLRDAGFTNLTTPAWGESAHPELRARETRVETLLIAEATK